MSRRRRMRPIKVATVAVFSVMFFGSIFILNKNAPNRSIYGAEITRNAPVTSSNGPENDLDYLTGEIYHETEKTLEIGTEDAQMLKQIAMAEAEGEGTYGKALVMGVVLNRMQSDEFPDTVEGVIFQPKQFSVVLDGGRYYSVIPDQECAEALELIESGWDETDGAMYFESCRGDSWHSRNLELLYQYGNHRFYK